MVHNNNTKPGPLRRGVQVAVVVVTGMSHEAIRADGATLTAMMSSPAVPHPLDPRLTLAMGIQSQPGVYALLLGSGVSTGAGIKTGWGIVKDLVRRAAVAAGANEAEAEAAYNNPEIWWSQHRDDGLLYSTLLDLVGGPTPASRRGVINQYFTASGEDIENGRKAPSPAHRAIADLVADGYVRVIVTTNFDNLTEQALHTVGIAPQVITRPAQVAGMQPLAHAPATIIKLHGDASELSTRNTPVELSTYPRAWNTLLNRITSEYGLLISGWSGETDKALVAALTRNPVRRYPLYWDRRSSKDSAQAQSVIAMHRGQVVPAADADELFGSLATSVKALTAMTEPPLTTALAVSALKAAIGDPTRHVEVEDLVLGAVRECVNEVGSRTTLSDGGYSELLAANLNSARRAVNLLVAGTYYDKHRAHADLCVEAVSGLLRARSSIPVDGSPAAKARSYPAAVAVRATGVLAVHRSRHGLVLDLMRRARGSDMYDPTRTSAAIIQLHDHRVLDRESLETLPGLKGRPYPESEHLRAVTFEFVRDYFTDEREYAQASDDYEFLVALIQWRNLDDHSGYAATSGMYVGEDQWADMTDLLAARRFQTLLATVNCDDDWPLWNLLGGRERAEFIVNDFEEVLLKRYRERLRS